MKATPCAPEHALFLNGLGTCEGLARRLLEFKSPGQRRRQAASAPLKILHLLSQQPGKTGSGVALLAMVRCGAQAGYRQRAVIGLPGSEPLPEIKPLAEEDVFPVRFDRPPVSFPIPGMSDIMPYPSSRFSTFTADMLEGYLQAFAAALASATRDFRPDVIQSNHLWLLTALARVLFPDTPLCAYSHGTELRQLVNAARLAPVVVPACSAVDRVFALHADNRAKIAAAYGIPQARIRVVGAGFRDDLFTADPACAPAADRDELTVAYAGKISAPKGVPWLVEAMRRVRPPAGKRVRLLLAGSAGDAGGEVIRRQAEDLADVVFLGPLPQEKLAQVFQTADVFVLPSFFEGLPLVVIESLACGCRVVMTDLPGLDSWMPAGLSAEGLVERVPLPRLTGPDTPNPEDLPAFVERLAAAISRQLARSAECSRAPAERDCRLDPLTWQGVFKRMEASWRDLAAEKRPA
jgi:glycosyltransferase involved in cell wall biosynthesis